MKENVFVENGLKENDMIKVHIYDHNYSDQREIRHRNSDKSFRVYKKNGKLGIDWNAEHSAYTNKGDVFSPFQAFAQNVIFENVSTGEKYYFSNIEKGLIRVPENTSKNIEYGSGEFGKNRDSVLEKLHNNQDRVKNEEGGMQSRRERNRGMEVVEKQEAKEGAI